jgi:beta-fructofuranosidase
MQTFFHFNLSIIFFFLLPSSLPADTIMIADFESGNFDNWKVSGTAFGPGPANSTPPGQDHVSGYIDEYYANSHHGGVGTKGVITSPAFVIEKDYINFLSGGGYHPRDLSVKMPVDFWGDEACVTLVVDPTPFPYGPETLFKGHNNLRVGDNHVELRSRTGHGLNLDGSLELEWETWDVRSMKGRTAWIRIVDNCDKPGGFICADQIFQADHPMRDIQRNDEILRLANENVRRAEAETPLKRGFHFTPPVFGLGGHTMTFANGMYHLFYIYHPFLDKKHNNARGFWRYARSRDLVYWEHMPVIMWPSEELGSFVCASGKAVMGDDGYPYIIYTSRSSERGMDQMAARGSKDWVHWRKHPGNPVVTTAPPNPMTHETDNAVFKYKDSWYMVIGGGQFFKEGGEQVYKGCFSLYRSADLNEWEFLGVPFVAETKGWEEPDMFPLDDKWIVVAEPFGPSRYYVGDFDWENIKFKPERQDFLDYAGVAGHDHKKHMMHDFTGHYIFCDALEDDKGRRILVGIGPGGLALPRVVSLRPDGKLNQKPPVEFEKLRGNHDRASGFVINNATRRFNKIRSDLLEIKVEFEPDSADEFGLKVRCSGDGSRFVRIACDGEFLEVAGDKTPARLMEGETSLRLHVFLDMHRLEVFANDWVVYTESMTAIPPTDLAVEVFSDGGKTRVKTLDIWKLASIW